VNEELGDPEKLRLPLSEGVTVIAAHIASTGKYEGERSSRRLARMMREYQNLYSDISSLTQISKLGYIKEALGTEEFSGRLFWGSDFPLINTILVSPWYYLHRLGLKKTVALALVKNPWDRDIELKHELGVPADIFSRFQEMFDTEKLHNFSHGRQSDKKMLDK